MQALTKGAAVGILNALKTATTGYLADVTVRLFKSDFVPSADSLLTSIEEADFTGYAPVTPIAWGAPYTDVLGNAVMVGGVAQFDSTGNAVTNTIYGYYLTKGTGAGLTLVVAERFPSPIGVAGVGDSVIVLPAFSLPALATSYVTGG